jgi:hypothetical protein
LDAGGIVVSDLTTKEQDNVRAALRFLRARAGSWVGLAKTLKVAPTTPGNVANSHRVASPTLTFRVAKLAKVSVDDVLTGRFPPPGTCPHCGHVTTSTS